MEAAVNTTDNCNSNIAFMLPPIMTIETVEAIASEFKQLPLAGKTNLTLDDSKTMREMVSFTLKSAGYEVVEAEGRQGSARGVEW